MPFARDPASDSDVTHTVQGLAFVPLGISTGEVADAEHIDAGYCTCGSRPATIVSGRGTVRVVALAQLHLPLPAGICLSAAIRSADSRP